MINLLQRKAFQDADDQFLSNQLLNFIIFINTRLIFI